MLQKRRRSLLTLASYGTWDFDLASFPYVYNSLLSNGSEVVKGKIAKIYANGVINQGEYKGTNVGEIATEPYNLFDGEWESGTILNGNNYPSSGAKRTPSYISVLPSTNYTIENNATGNSYFFEYDKDKNFIQRQDLLNYGGSKTLTSNTHYVRLVVVNEVTQCCFHRTGTRTGYAPHKPSASIPFIFQGNGNETNHDSLEIAKTEFVFTKEVNYVDSVTMPTTLATPQVIRIPRKHLGIVDLGTLNWTVGSQYGETQTDDLGGIIKPIPNGNTILNAYCFKYIMTYANVGYHSTTLDKIIYQWQESVATGGRIVVLDTDFKGKTTQEIQALLSGTYLFYETAEEVNDIATRIFTENGGTVTTDSEVLPNLNLDLPVKV